ncbi:MAG: mechanosensitive ion channel [Proteobacteria bacterium]|nr:mechanosensitive ion channel [Pseudomonadota bacterium]
MADAAMLEAPDMDQIAVLLSRYHVNVSAIVTTLVVLCAASLVVFLLQRVLRNWLRRIAPLLHLKQATPPTVIRIVSIAIWAITLILVLAIWGVSVGGLWALLVSAAAVIGVGFFATWTMVSNMTASVFIAIWRPFHLGDAVEILPEGLRGHVIDRNLMFVTLREDAGGVIHVPNNQFFQKIFKVNGNSRPPLPQASQSDANR